MFRQDRTNPSTAISNWRGRHDTPKGWPSTAVSSWLNGGLFGGNPSIATTGSPNVVDFGGYRRYEFTGSGTWEILANPEGVTFDVLVVGGGGATAPQGAAYQAEAVGGGGGSAVRTFTGQTGTVQSYTVTIGAGGTGADGGGHSVMGANTVYGGGGANQGGGWAPINAAGGGGGGGYSAYLAPYVNEKRNGASGGTYGADSGGIGAGYNYGNWHQMGSGGGGSTGTGGATSSVEGTTAGAAGGAGTSNDYASGSGQYYGGGGGGGISVLQVGAPTKGGGGSGVGGDGGIAYNNNATEVEPEDGDANTGGGAGGAAGSSLGISFRGSGGSGVVVIKIPWS